MKHYVIYLSTARDCDPIYQNNTYGYYAGKTYTYEGQHFPWFDNSIVERTKRYASKNRAENAAKRLYVKCSYVSRYEIEEV
ncbi:MULTISPECIES: hypothetical protein [unclassified Paenibacillus]|uniref:hypothetical protein n=1 Tax=unclassified Paenibacillus TaxID=185978 RepID=UPI0036D21DA6